MAPDNAARFGQPGALHASATPPPPGIFAVSSIGGYQGSTYVSHKSGDSYEYSEDVAVTFDKALLFSSFRYAISPKVPSSEYQTKYGTPPAITFRKVPGTTYAITIPAGVQAVDGSKLASAYKFTITTDAAPSVPPPTRSTLGEPYRYGVREQPADLGGSNGDRIIALLAAAGVRFVRLDYCGSSIESQKDTFDWSEQDAIMNKLSAVGITELPIVDQYCAPSWANGNNEYPYIWNQPADYAAFAGAIAAHVAGKYPMINRIELFNEPNVAYWWQNSNPVYAESDGSAAAAYMAAAYGAIKMGAPGLTVVGPALDGGSGSSQFLLKMYAAGCKTSRCWDVLSVHNYCWCNPTFHFNGTTTNQWSVYQQLQLTAANQGDGTPRIMLTEWGLSTYDSQTGFDPAVQARYIALGFNLMLADPSVDGIVYVNVYNSGSDFWGRTALTTTGFSQLPGYAAYQQFAAH